MSIFEKKPLPARGFLKMITMRTFGQTCSSFDRLHPTQRCSSKMIIMSIFIKTYINTYFLISLSSKMFMFVGSTRAREDLIAEANV